MFKLGKNGKKHDYRTLQYNKYNQNVASTITVPTNFGHQDLISDGAGMLGDVYKRQIRHCHNGINPSGICI